MSVYTPCATTLDSEGDCRILSLSIPDDENTTSRFEDSEHYQNYARLIGNQFSIWLVNFTLREKLRNLSIGIR